MSATASAQPELSGAERAAIAAVRSMADAAGLLVRACLRPLSAFPLGEIASGAPGAEARLLRAWCAPRVRESVEDGLLSLATALPVPAPAEAAAQRPPTSARLAAAATTPAAHETDRRKAAGAGPAALAAARGGPADGAAGSGMGSAVACTRSNGGSAGGGGGQRVATRNALSGGQSGLRSLGGLGGMGGTGGGNSDEGALRAVLAAAGATGGSTEPGVRGAPAATGAGAAADTSALTRRSASLHAAASSPRAPLPALGARAQPLPPSRQAATAVAATAPATFARGAATPAAPAASGNPPALCSVPDMRIAHAYFACAQQRALNLADWYCDFCRRLDLLSSGRALAEVLARVDARPGGKGGKKRKTAEERRGDARRKRAGYGDDAQTKATPANARARKQQQRRAAAGSDSEAGSDEEEAGLGDGGVRAGGSPSQAPAADPAMLARFIGAVGSMHVRAQRKPLSARACAHRSASSRERSRSPAVSRIAFR